MYIGRSHQNVFALFLKSIETDTELPGAKIFPIFLIFSAVPQIGTTAPLASSVSANFADLSGMFRLIQFWRPAQLFNPPN